MRRRPFLPTTAGRYGGDSAIPPVQGEPDITCYHLPETHAGQSLCVPLIARGEAIGLLTFQNVTASDAPSRAYLELMAEALGALANQRLRSALLEKRCSIPDRPA